MNENGSIAKITRPRLSGIASRERLFRLLDEGRKKPVTWVAAPAGSGKTTLVASWLDSRKLPCLWYQVDEGDGDRATFFFYMGLAAKKAAPRHKKFLPLLTPEYLQSIPTFTRRFFENLFSRLKPPFTVVLDNYQDAPLQSGFHEMIAHALDVIPEGVNFIVVSRAEPHAQLSRLKANNKINLLGWEEIRFTFEESSELMDTHGRGKLTEEVQHQLYEKTEGWAAGLVLMMENARKGEFQTIPLLNTRSEVFDYFASEIFNKSDKAIQQVLVKTAFLPKIDPAMAEKITGIDSAGQILERLSHNHYFTQRYMQTYQYHPLFREFLLIRAQNTFSQAELSLIQRHAAALLVEVGQIEDAAHLLCNAGDWDGLTKLILSHAQTLAAQGRSRTLEEWISGMPKEIVEETPWLLYWLGICRLAFDPTQARGYLEKAFSLFENENDISGLFLSWSSIIDTFIYEWRDFRPVDHWIAVAYKIIGDHPGFPTPEIEARVVSGMFNALCWRQTQHPDLPKWAERLNRIVLGGDNFAVRVALGNSLLLYYLLMGDFSKATLLVDVMRKAGLNPANEPLALLWWYGMESMYSEFLGNHEASLAAVSRGLNLGEKTGVHLMDFFLFYRGISSELALGRIENAEELLSKMGNRASRTVDKALYHYQASAVKWHRGNLSAAIEHSKQAVRFGEENAVQFLTTAYHRELAIILFDIGQRAEAEEELARALTLARGLTHLEFICRLYGAWFAFEQDKEEMGLRELRLALEIGAQQNYVNFHRWRPQMMSRLCAKALEYGIEPEYVKMLIRKRNLLPEKPVENWPYSIRIYTLRRFEIVKDGKPVVFNGKVQKKPLELLKLLVDCGGQATEGHISDALWPESEGDMAHNSFKMALSRLRHLIGKDSIGYQDGKLSLNPNRCWVDALAVRL